MTIASRIQAIATEMADDKPSPAVLRSFEVALAGLLPNLNLEVVEADVAHKKAILAADAKSATAKEQIAEAGPSYERLLRARADRDSCDQMIKTCRSSLRSLENELRGSR